MADVLNAKMEELIQENGGRGSAKSLPEARVYSPGPTIEASAPQETAVNRPWEPWETELFNAIDKIDPWKAAYYRKTSRDSGWQADELKGLWDIYKFDKDQQNRGIESNFLAKNILPQPE